MKPRLNLYTLFWLVCIPLVVPISGSFSGLVSQARADGSCQTSAFFIEGVEVSARANDAEVARQMAMDEALEAAWKRLAGRVLLEPEAMTFDNASVRNLVDYVRIDKETVLPKRYLATLTYCFDRDMTRAYLDERDLVHAELRSSPMLILPVWNMSDQPRLWRRPNPWAEAWTALMRQRDGLVDLKLVGSLGTERALTAEDVTAFDSYSLARAAQLEGVEQVVVTVVTPRMEGGRLKAAVQATLFDRQGVKESEFFRRDDVVFSSVETAGSMAELAAEIEGQIEYVWRDVNRISLRESGAFTLRIDASSVRQWSQQLALLKSLAPVEDLKVMQLDSGGGQVRLMLSSSMRSLNYALESAGLDLDSQITAEGSQQFVLVARNR